MTSWHELTIGQRNEIMQKFIHEGETAAIGGGLFCDCPYRSDKQEAKWWHRGFGNARLGAMLANKC